MVTHKQEGSERMTVTTEQTTYVVKFQRGHRVGARSLRMEYVDAGSHNDAVRKAKKLFPTWKDEGYFVLGVCVH